MPRMVGGVFPGKYHVMRAASFAGVDNDTLHFPERERGNWSVSVEPNELASHDMFVKYRHTATLLIVR